MLVSIVAVTCLWMLLAPIVLNLHSATFSNMFPVFLYIGFIVALPGQILFFISSFFLRAKQKKQISYVLWATVFAFVNGISLIILLTITGLPPASGMFSELLILLSFIIGGMITGTLYGRAISYSQN